MTKSEVEAMGYAVVRGSQPITKGACSPNHLYIIDPDYVTITGPDGQGFLTQKAAFKYLKESLKAAYRLVKTKDTWFLDDDQEWKVGHLIRYRGTVSFEQFFRLQHDMSSKDYKGIQASGYFKELFSGREDLTTEHGIETAIDRIIEETDWLEYQDFCEDRQLTFELGYPGQEIF